jgi:hypothetical protein
MKKEDLYVKQPGLYLDIGCDGLIGMLSDHDELLMSYK